MASIGDSYHFLILSLILSKERLNFKKYKTPLLRYSWATLETRNLGLKKPPIAWDFQSWSSSVVVESVLKLAAPQRESKGITKITNLDI